ncbi:MAG: AraC family transcriptional regulator [Eubacteriales bacterium]|nr:AraC family transcriptional regulator [Eubacteriales bacterium]
MSIARYEGANTIPSPAETSPEAVGIRLLYATHSRYENDWESAMHTHPFTELFYVIGGEGFFLVDDEKFPLRKDDFVIVNPNTLHTESSSGNSPLEYVILGVDNANFAISDGHDYIIFNCAAEHQDLLFYMNAMLRELEEPRHGYERICQDLLEVLIIKLIRRTDFAFEVIPSVRIRQECQKIKRYMENNYSRDITLDTLADVSHLNKFYLVHVFKKYCGCSPISYLCRVRVKASRELLASTDYSITYIAQMCGFSSQSYFSQCFQKSCGLTAGAYRRQAQKEAEEKTAAQSPPTHEF